MKRYFLENRWLRVQFLDFGGMLIDLIKKTNQTNYLLHYNKLATYKKNPYFLGATIGRNAGRTYPAYYQNYLDEKIILDQNENTVHLHGGNKGLHQVTWQVHQVSTTECVLTYKDCQSVYEEMDFEMHYRLNDNQFIIDISGASLVPTIANLTNHAYFNLDSNKSTIENHVLKLAPAKIQLINQTYVPTEIYHNMQNEFRSFDFTESAPIKKALNGSSTLSKICSNGIDLAYLFTDATQPKISLQNATKENKLTIYSNQESCVLYTLNKIQEKVAINQGKIIEKFNGITFEMQRLPNYVHHQKNYLSKDYQQETIYEII